MQTINGAEHLSAFYTCKNGVDSIKADQIREFIARKLPSYMIPSYYTRLTQFPLTPNGKVAVKALKELPVDTSERIAFEAPRTEEEKKLFDILSVVLDFDEFGINDDLFTLGLTSLTMISVIARIDDAFGLSLRVTDFMRLRTVAKLAEEIRSLLEDGAGDESRQMEGDKRCVTDASGGMTPEEYEMEARKHPHLLTQTQRYFIDTALLKPKAPVWNNINLFRIDKEKIGKVCDAINKVMRSTPIFSTRIYFDEDSELKQRYVPELCPTLNIEQTSEEDFAKLRTELAKPTNIVDTPLYYVRIFETETNGYLFINRHHIATDGMAKNILYKRIADAYRGEALPLDTYYSYLQRSEEPVRDEDIESHRKYFLERYFGVDWTFLPNTDLDLKEERPNFFISPASVSAKDVAEFEKRAGVTRNQLFNICMLLATAKQTGSRNVMMTYAFHNRTDKTGREALGCLFVDLPLAARLDSCRNAAELCDDIMKQAIGNLAHAAFNWQDLLVPGKRQVIGSIAYETDEIMGSTSAFHEMGMEELQIDFSDQRYLPMPLVSQIMDTPRGLLVMYFYQANRYSEEAIGKYAADYNAMLKTLVSAENLAEVSIEELCFLN